MVSNVFRKELKLILKCRNKREQYPDMSASHNRSMVGVTNKTIQQT